MKMTVSRSAALGLTPVFLHCATLASAAAAPKPAKAEATPEDTAESLALQARDRSGGGVRCRPNGKQASSRSAEALALQALAGEQRWPT